MRGTGFELAETVGLASLGRRDSSGTNPLLFSRSVRGTGFEPQSLRFAPFPASNSRHAFAAHELFAAKCAGPDSNRNQTCSLASLVARVW